MKKTFLLISGLALCISQSHAQANAGNEITAYIYSADKVTHCHVLNAAPGAQVEFYSERWGGKLIKQENIGVTGTLEISENRFAPAFVIDKNTNRVFFMEPQEFSIEEIGLKKVGNLNRISWTATTNPGKEIAFGIMKSNDGINYKEIKALSAVTTADEFHYSYDDVGNENSYYKIKVINQKAGVRYSSHSMKLGVKDIVIYPSLVNTTLTIDVLSGQTDLVFSVSNMNGQVVKKGMLSFGTNTINTTELSSGSYIVNITGGTLNLSEKIIKE